MRKIVCLSDGPGRAIDLGLWFVRIAEEAAVQSATYYLKMRGEPVEKPENPLACALRELVEPDARVAEAVACMFAEVDDLGPADLEAADPAALRRAGYLLERFGNSESTLHELILAAHFDGPVYFTPHITVARGERLRREADAAQIRWGVYGNVELRAS